MAESWRKLDVEEWGNAIRMPVAGIRNALIVLHRDAAKTLPPGTRYDIQLSDELASGGGIAWYSHSLMTEIPTWNGFGQRPGYYVIGQYLTPKTAESPQNGGAT